MQQMIDKKLFLQYNIDLFIYRFPIFTDPKKLVKIYKIHKITAKSWHLKK